MSDTIEMYRDMKNHKKRLREMYGVECPVCREKRPKAFASILLPKQRCRVDGYVDQRAELTDEQYSNC